MNESDKEPLDDKVMDFFQSKTLSASRLDLLLAQSQSIRSRKWIPLYFAAAVLLTVMASMVHRHSLVNERVSIALREAALNHKTKLQMDFESANLASLKSNMEKLDFSLRLPSNVNNQTLTLVGSRYCTIAGNLAAHLRFTHADSDLQLSLFMTPIESELENMVSNVVNIEGVNVKLWQENGLFYALADSPISL